MVKYKSVPVYLLTSQLTYKCGEKIKLKKKKKNDDDEMLDKLNESFTYSVTCTATYIQRYIKQ
jgi:hypothetical protein